MAQEQGTGLRFDTAFDAQATLRTAVMPFTMERVAVTPSGAEATLVHRTDGLDQVRMTGVSPRTNGEDDSTLVFNALRDAVGNPDVAGAQYLGQGTSSETGNVVVSFTDTHGLPWRSEAPGFRQAAAEGLAAAVVTLR